LSPEQIKQLRSKLGLTAQELAQTLGVELRELQAWEQGERFPTKRTVKRLQALAEEEQKASGSFATAHQGLERLSDPEFWALVRKLIAHPKLFADAQALSKQYDDPNP
jgi:transcriptional regulator with XRE-family HTH domain